jgi:hypothetical protein
VLERQIKDLENERRQRIRRDDTAHVAMVRILLELWGVGLNANCLPGVALTIASKFLFRAMLSSVTGGRRPYLPGRLGCGDPC